jgi:hypothetical protein
MKRNLFLLSVLFLFKNAIFATTITSVVCGNWTNPTTWNLNRVPVSTDTIVINTFASFDTDFTSISPGLLNVTVCGTLCGSHNYTGHFLFNGVVFMNQLTASYGHSISNSAINIQQMLTVTGSGTSYDVSNSSVCVGCTSPCQNCSASKTDTIGCTQNAITIITNNNRFYFYPNPAATALSIKGITDKTNIKLFDIFGKLVLDFETETNTAINTSQFANGMYTIIAEDNKGKTFNKVLIANN